MFGLKNANGGDSQKNSKTKVADSLTNIHSGLNTCEDPRTHNVFTGNESTYYDRVFSNPKELYSAYRDSWLARAVCEMPAEDALSEWRTFNCKEATEIAAEEERIGLPSEFLTLTESANLAGGAVLVMIIEDQNLEDELDVERVKKGAFKGLKVFDRYMISSQGQDVTDFLSDHWLLPEYYLVGEGSQRVHYTNVIRMNGSPLPRYLLKTTNGWGDSKLRQCMEELKDLIASRGGLAGLLQKANQDILKVKGIANASTTSQEQQIIKRMSLFKMGLSNLRLGMLDSEEDLQRLGAAFSGTAELLEILMTFFAGAAKVPMSRLYGMQSKGFGDSGEGDLKNYHKSLRSDQKRRYTKPLQKIDQVLIRSALGYLPDDVSFTWNPLHQDSGNDLAQQRLARSSVDTNYVQLGVTTRAKVMRELRANNTYDFTDEEIKVQEALDKQEAKLEEAGKIDAVEPSLGNEDVTES